jgi:hypothetical protein
MTAGVKSGIAWIDWIVTYMTDNHGEFWTMMVCLGKTEAMINAAQRNRSQNGY